MRIPRRLDAIKNASHKTRSFSLLSATHSPPVLERPPPLLERHHVLAREVLHPLVELLDRELRECLVGDGGGGDEVGGGGGGGGRRRGDDHG